VPLTDRQAKEAISSWPNETRLWSLGSGISWLRAQPVIDAVAGPRLELPGAGAFRTQPDGLWVSLGINRSDTETQATYADCIVIESCGRAQNFADKRSRYAARTSSLMLGLPKPWLEVVVSIQGGGSRTRRQVLRGRLSHDENLALPVRQLRVLYALPDDDPSKLYARVSSQLSLEAHEFVCPQPVLRQYNAQKTQAFLKRMGPHHQRFK
jgi:hypothetical protein